MPVVFGQQSRVAKTNRRFARHGVKRCNAATCRYAADDSWVKGKEVMRAVDDKGSLVPVLRLVPHRRHHGESVTVERVIERLGA